MEASTDLLLRFGPVLLFVMAVAETAVPAGLVVPAGVALATAAALAHQGLLPWEGVLAAAMVGAVVGDSLGYWLGRRGVRVLDGRSGRLGAVVAAAQLKASRLFRSHSLLAVTGGRLVAFVRTLMPPVAGVSGITYPRFLAYEIPGVVGWALLYVALGLGAAETLRSMTAGGMPGVVPLLVLALVGVALWLHLRLWRRRAAAGGEPSAPVRGGAEERRAEAD